METFVYKERLDRYLKAPLFTIGILLIVDFWSYTKSVKMGLFLSLLVAVYAVVVWGLYQWSRTRLSEGIINFATSYGTVQKEMLKKLEVPYVLMDLGGRILWTNDAFDSIHGKKTEYQSSITKFFSEIQKDVIDQTKDSPEEISVEWNGRSYKATLRREPIEEADTSLSMAGLTVNVVISMMLFDTTREEELKRKLKDERFVSALVYIDNYEESVESVESVRRSLLTAMIDRKLNKYFQGCDAVLRKTERDKYFVVFPYKYLKVMEDERFAILEDMKSLRAGNENEITISMGIGIGDGGYIQSTDYAHAAIDLALGRGGAQAVVKEGMEVSYYGVRGKEVERTTRVKARVKAQALREMMSAREKILVMGHQLSDIDAFGAAVGVYVAAREVGKDAKIVLDTVTTSLRPFVDLFTEEEGYPADMIISNDEALDYCDSESLVIVVDTNRPSYTECPELLTRTSNIVVFDHHRIGEEIVENPILSYIEPYASSACEMIAEMLPYFAEKIEMSDQEADSIYAGILIDTDNFVTKTGVRTFEAAAYLRRSGSDVTRVRKLLREDMDTYRARADVVRNAEVYRNKFAISVCRSKEVGSPTIVGAQAANELLNIVGIKASFVLTEFKGKVYISSRSIDEIDVQSIMESMGGGGHLNIAGAQIPGGVVEDEIQRLKDILDIAIDKGEIVL